MANLTELSRKEDSVILLELLEPFKELLTDDEITEIAVNRPGQIYFEKRGRWIKKDAPELTFKTLKQIGFRRKSGIQHFFPYSFRRSSGRRKSSIRTTSGLPGRHHQCHYQKAVFPSTIVGRLRPFRFLRLRTAS